MMGPDLLGLTVAVWNIVGQWLDFWSNWAYGCWIMALNVDLSIFCALLYQTSLKGKKIILRRWIFNPCNFSCSMPIKPLSLGSSVCSLHWSRRVVVEVNQRSWPHKVKSWPLVDLNHHHWNLSKRCMQTTLRRRHPSLQTVNPSIHWLYCRIACPWMCRVSHTIYRASFISPY